MTRYSSFIQESAIISVKRSLTSNFLYQATYQVLIILIPLVTTPYLSRVIGAEGVGTYSYTYAIANYFVMVAMLGISTYGVREIASCGDDREKRSLMFWGAYTAQLIVGVPVVLTYLVYSIVNPIGGFPIVAAWGLWVLSAILDVSWLLFGVEEFKIPTVCSIISKLVSVVGIFAFVHSPDDVWAYCLVIAIGLLLAQVLIWPFVRRYVDFVRPDWGSIKRHFKPNLILFLPVIATNVYNSMDKIFLGALAGMEQTGFFEYSEKLSRMPLSVVTALGTVMLPRMTAYLAENKEDEALALLETSVWAMLAAAFALAFGIAAIAPEFAPIFLGDEFASCDVIMMVLAIIIPVISLTNVIGRQYLIPAGRDTEFTKSVFVGAIVNVIVNLALIPSMGAMGAAIATVAAELGVLFAQIFYARGKLPILRYVVNSIPFAVIGLIMAAVVRISATWFNSMWGLSVQGLVLEVLVGVVAFSATAVVWCVVVKDRHFLSLIKRRGN